MHYASGLRLEALRHVLQQTSADDLVMKVARISLSCPHQNQLLCLFRLHSFFKNENDHNGCGTAEIDIEKRNLRILFFSQFLLILTQLDSSFRHIVRYLLLLYHIFGRRGYTETKCGDPHKQQEESGRQ